VWSNIFSLTVLVTLCAILGVVVTSATEVIYGVSTWSPLQVSSLMGSRAAQFFSALPWALSVLATNISGTCLVLSFCPAAPPGRSVLPLCLAVLLTLPCVQPTRLRLATISWSCFPNTSTSVAAVRLCFRADGTGLAQG